MESTAIYARVSTQDQAADGKVTIPIQVGKCQELAERNGYQVVGVYVDDKRYRATRNPNKGMMVEPSSLRRDRPEYQRLIKDIRSGKVGRVLLWKWDRLGSDRGAWPFIDVWKDTDITVETVKEGIQQPEWLQVETIFRGRILKDMHDRLMSAGAARLEKGKGYGGYERYGHTYDADLDTWVVNEKEAPWVKAIFDWYVGGVSVKEIRRRLITEKAPQKGRAYKRAWHEGVIRGILHNEAYTGTAIVTWGGVPYEVPCPGIVSKATFQKAQERMAHNQTWRNRNVKLPYLLGGMLKCGDCGNLWHSKGTRYRYKNGKRFERKTPMRHYRCAIAAKYPDECSCNKSINADLLEQTVWDAVTDLLRNGEGIKEKIDKRIAELRETREERQAEAYRLEAKFNALQQERQWLILQARKQVITQEDFEAQLEMLDTEGAELTLAYQEAAADIPEHLDELWWTAWEQIAKETKAFQGLDFEGKRKLLETLVDEVVIDPELGTLYLHGTLERLVYFGTEKARS